MIEHYTDRLRFWSLLILTFVLIQAVSVFAQVNATDNSTQYCLDNNILTVATTREICIEGECDTVERVWNQRCEYGCDVRNNICFAPPWIRFGWIFLLIIIILVGLYLAWRYL